MQIAFQAQVVDDAECVSPRRGRSECSDLEGLDRFAKYIESKGEITNP